jgi:hypothetical protein
LPRLVLLLSLGLLARVTVTAQELSFLAGGMSTRDVQLSTYAWQVDYVQNFARNFAGSVAYLNEGHIVGHHRDGTAFELAARLPLFHDRLAISAGLGPYFYYDTQPLPGGDTADVHGTATIYSLTANYYLSNRWFLKAAFNRIDPRHDVRTNTTALGLGFWFGRDQKPTPGKLGDAPGQDNYVTENQLTVFGGQSVINTFLSQHALAAAGEYRRGLAPHIDLTGSAIYEGDPHIVRRSGLATQLWAVNTFFHESTSVGVGLGPYFYIDRRHPKPAPSRNPAAAAPLLSLTLATRLSDQWLARLVFDRVVTSYNRDADIFLLGLGYRWQ